MDLLIAHRRGDWAASYLALSRADAVGPMALDDVEAFAAAAWRLGHAQEAVRLGERVYDRLVRTDPAAASMTAIDVALQWFTRGDGNIGRGWLDRARRLLAGAPVGPAHGYLAYLDATAPVRDGGAAGLSAKVATMRAVCADTDDASLPALSAVVHALGAFHDGRLAEGYAFVDRAIPSMESGEVRLEWAGDAYALLLLAGRAIDDVAHSRDWAESMARWCGAHEAVLYHRVVRVYRASTEPELLTESWALEGVHALAAGECTARLGELRAR